MGQSEVRVTPTISTQTLSFPVQALRTIAGEATDTTPTQLLKGQLLTTCWQLDWLAMARIYCIISHLQVGRSVRALEMVSLGFSGQVWPCGASGHCWGLAGEDFAPQFWNWRPATYLLSFSLGIPPGI